MKSTFEQLQVLFRKEFNFEYKEILSGQFRLYSKLYPILEEFTEKTLSNLINSEFKEYLSEYNKDFFLKHLYDFFLHFFQVRDQGIKQEQSNYQGTHEKSKELEIERYYYHVKPFQENLLIHLENGYKLCFYLIYKEPEREGKDNVKKYLILDTSKNAVIILPYEKKIIVNFQYRMLKKEEIKKFNKYRLTKIKKFCYEMILNQISEPDVLEILKKNHKFGKNDNLTQYLDLYYSRLESDNFIYIHLKKLLQKRLKIYIQQNFMSILLKNSEERNYFEILKKNIRSFEFIANEIIKILYKLENIKIALFLKKKFVYNTNFGLSLKRIPQKYFPEILKNKNQIEQWRRNPYLKTYFKNKDNLTFESLKNVPFLVIDTKNFNPDFKYNLISEFSKLNHSISGLLIKSDNFQAMKLISTTFQKAIKCIYIDPPYNTGQNFLYNDSFERGAWLTMMENRLRLAINFLSSDGLFYSSIDDNELAYYSILIDKIFKKRLNTIVWHKKTQPSYLSKELIPVTEYIITAKNINEPIKLMGGYGDLKKLTELINIGNLICERELNKENLLINSGKWSGTLKNGIYGKEKLQVELLNGPIRVQKGISNQNLILRSRFKWSQERIDLEIKKGGIIHIKSIKSLRPTIQRHYDTPIIKAPTTLLSKKINLIPTNTDANTELKNLFKISNFDYPKPKELIKYLIRAVTYFEKEGTILDFFAGTGTTAHSVLELNSADNGHRKYILIEKEDYFEKLLVPRIQKIMFSSKWKDGTPISNTGYDHFYKSIALEQFSDCFWNIILKEEISNRDKILKYIIDWDNDKCPISLNIKKFDNPFDYKIMISENGILEEKYVDLIETFNFLLGLCVLRTLNLRHQNRRYIIVFGNQRNSINTRVIVIWRDISGLNLVEEEKFLKKKVIDQFSFDEIFFNGQFSYKNAKPIEKLFNKLMFEIEI
ncbi:MAG: site-specific DNA-methyltransferase [Promethearchaeota archaeon]